jgi:hypothetical protein
MDGSHEGALIKIWDENFAVRGPFPHACFTEVIVFDPGSKRPAANRATGVVNAFKVVHTGRADRKPGPVRISPLVSQEPPAEGTPRRIDEVDELPKDGHGENRKDRIQNTGVRRKTLTHLFNNILLKFLKKQI